jgi:hypothetical protein
MIGTTTSTIRNLLFSFSAQIVKKMPYYKKRIHKLRCQVVALHCVVSIHTPIIALIGSAIVGYLCLLK